MVSTWCKQWFSLLVQLSFKLCKRGAAARGRASSRERQQRGEEDGDWSARGGDSSDWWQWQWQWSGRKNEAIETWLGAGNEGRKVRKMAAGQRGEEMTGEGCDCNYWSRGEGRGGSSKGSGG
ncbi:hypothetical protein BHM03_00045566 [Ensete ventricosum]|nr:hypothetical protein BHM03_00045566 [Ensete ventricosum]